MLADWSRCQHLLKWGIDKTSGNRGKKHTTLSRLRVREGVAVIDTNKLYAFVDDYSSANTIGMWCDGVYSRESTLSDADHHALPSPFATNPSAFARYANESMLSKYRANVAFGAALGCQVLAFVALKVADMST